MWDIDDGLVVGEPDAITKVLKDLGKYLVLHTLEPMREGESELYLGREVLKTFELVVLSPN